MIEPTELVVVLVDMVPFESTCSALTYVYESFVHNRLRVGPTTAVTC
jgi:hypothetical protein